MFETKVTYLSHKRKTYVTPWIHVRNVDLRGGMMAGVSAEAPNTEEDPNKDQSDFAKESINFFSDPFENDLDDFQY